MTQPASNADLLVNALHAAMNAAVLYGEHCGKAGIPVGGAMNKLVINGLLQERGLKEPDDKLKLDLAENQMQQDAAVRAMNELCVIIGGVFEQQSAVIKRILGEE